MSHAANSLVYGSRCCVTVAGRHSANSSSLALLQGCNESTGRPHERRGMSTRRTTHLPAAIVLHTPGLSPHALCHMAAAGFPPLLSCVAAGDEATIACRELGGCWLRCQCIAPQPARPSHVASGMLGALTIWFDAEAWAGWGASAATAADIRVASQVGYHR
jgi:hypothetical protein